MLNQRGLETGAGATFSIPSIRWVRHSAGLKSLKQRLHAAGWLTMQEFSARLGVRFNAHWFSSKTSSRPEAWAKSCWPATSPWAVPRRSRCCGRRGARPAPAVPE